MEPNALPDLSARTTDPDRTAHSALAKFIRKTDRVVREEVPSGHRYATTGAPVEIIADIVTSTGADRHIVDVGITSASVVLRHFPARFWPTQAEVVAGVDKDDQDALVMDTTKPIWRLRAHPGRHVREMKKFRELTVARTLDKVVGEMCSEKLKKYASGGITVIPFVMTAQGYLAKSASDFIDTIADSIPDEDDRFWFRSRLLCRVSVLLLRTTHRVLSRSSATATSVHIHRLRLAGWL
jgi:hypothetical protein